MKATIHERGNGFPDLGDWVYEPDTDTVYAVTKLGRIQTQQHSANYMHVEVQPTGHAAGDLSDQQWESMIDCCIKLSGIGGANEPR